MKLKISLASFAVFLLAVFTISAAIPPAESLLPTDTLLMFTVPDCSAVRAAAKQSPQWLLWDDPAMKPFRDDFTAKWENKFLGPLEQNLGLKISDYLPLLQGQFTVAVTQNGWNGSSDEVPAMLLLLDAKNKSDLLATNLAALKQRWMDAGKPVRTETLQDIKFSVLTLSSNTSLPLLSNFSRGGNDAASPGKLYIGQDKSLLIVGTSAKAVGSVVSRLSGGANPALGDNAQFAMDQLAQFHDAPLYYGWFNGKTFFNVLSEIQSSQDSDASSFSWSKALMASGLTGLKSVSFSYRESHDGVQGEFFVDAPESTRQGLVKIVAASPEDANPPPFVPADAMKFWRWRVDGQKSWNELEKALATISPQMSTYLDSIIMMANTGARQQDPSFDIRKDLIGNLGDDWISYAKAPSGNTLADMNSAPWLFLFGAKNADQTVLAMKTVAGMAGSGNAPATRDFLGRKIYTIPLPSGRATDASGTAAPQRSLYCAASGGYVALTTDVSMIENYLRSDDGKTKPLSQMPGLADAAQRVGGMGNGLFGYQNEREAMRSIFSAFKNDPAFNSSTLNPLAGLPFMSGNGLRDLMDFSLLPDYGQVSKYFGFSVYSGTTTSQGLDFKFFTPRPPELN
jgi:hypothetical protein